MVASVARHGIVTRYVIQFIQFNSIIFENHSTPFNSKYGYKFCNSIQLKKSLFSIQLKTCKTYVQFKSASVLMIFNILVLQCFFHVVFCACTAFYLFQNAGLFSYFLVFKCTFYACYFRYSTLFGKFIVHISTTIN